MIYIVSGNDTGKINSYLKKIYNSNFPIVIPSADFDKTVAFEYASSVNLFGEYPIVLIENFLKELGKSFSAKELAVLQESKTVFVFREEKLLVADIKKYSKFGEIKDFSIKEAKPAPKINVFNIADSFARKDKINTWILYREAILTGVSPEEISGLIFWKIKMMLTNGSKSFSSEDLKKLSSLLVELYHKSHKGEVDFPIGLEQFILSSLTK